jgi:hypothetical protein
MLSKGDIFAPDNFKTIEKRGGSSHKNHRGNSS